MVQGIAAGSCRQVKIKMSNSAVTAIKSLLQTETTASLGPEGRPGTLSAAELEERLTALLAPLKLAPIRQQVIRALLLLWHDHLDAAHEISQGINNADGSFVHAIMHRREPDYWNSNYWWRRVGPHPAYAELGQKAEQLLEKHNQRGFSARLVSGGSWRPEGFVACCEQAAGDGANLDLLRELQRIETEVLLDHFLSSRG